MSNCHKNIFKVSEKECLECIQKYNKNININNVYGGNRPIYRVTDYGHYKCVELLLKNGAMHKKDNYSMTPLQLHLNSKFGWDDCIILLLQNRETRKKEYYDDTSLNCASKNGHDKCIKLLLKYGATHEKTNYGDTPLYNTIYHDNDKCVKLLLKYGALQNGYNSGFTQEELKQYVKPVYVENINQYDWQTETLFYLINSKLNFNLTCSVIELLFYGILSFI